MRRSASLRSRSIQPFLSSASVDLVRHRFKQVFGELPGRSPVSFVDEPGDGELDGAVDGDEQVKLAFGSLHLGDIYVEEPDGISLEALALGLVALDIRQAGDVVALEAAMQCRSCQVRDGRR